MTSTLLQRVGAALVGIALFSSCSRPVAYFQRGPADPAIVRQTQTVASATAVPVVALPTESVAQVTETLPSSDAYVSVSSKPVTHKQVNERSVRMTNLLGSARATLSPTATHAARKMNGIQRLMLKQLNKRIGHQLAPNHPEKALVKTGKLVGSLVLLIGGLLLLILGTGTVAFIGLIVSLVGGVGVVVSLFGIDSY